MGDSIDPCCKVGRAIQRYGLDRGNGVTVDEELLTTRWTGSDGGEALGYRRLAEWFNRQLLRQAYRDAGTNDDSFRVNSEFEALSSGDVITQESARDRVEDAGIDADELMRSFVSWSTMGRHLTDCLNATKDTTQAVTDWERNSVDIAQNVLEGKLEKAIRSLTNKGELQDGANSRVTVSVKIGCTHCPRTVPFDTALDRGYVCPVHHDSSDVHNSHSP